jgi:thymidylate synthase
MMYSLQGRTADELYKEACWTFQDNAKTEDTRNGVALSIPYPSMITLTRPEARVLFNTERDANPFFHLMESIWMMAGRNDLVFLHQFNKGMSQFAEDNGTFHGAYGHRWREHFDFDQLLHLARTIPDDPTSRQHVLTMWDAHDLHWVTKDKPCNMQIVFRVVGGRLDMTVFNRSNDLVWGALGANIVHMTMLHEFMSLSTNIAMGVYRVITNNLHVYEQHWPLLAHKVKADIYFSMPCVPLHGNKINPRRWLGDCETFCDGGTDFEYPWFERVAAPMRDAYLAKEPQSRMAHAEDVDCPAWRAAAILWLQRRVK